MKKLLLLFLISVPVISKSQDLKLNEREYFERQGINVLVFRILAQNGWYVLRSEFAQLMRIMSDGSSEQAYQGEIKTWGPYYKYNYVKFDFSEVRQAITLRTSMTGHSFGAKTRALLLEIPSM
jgi:hypothetical protein